MFMKPPVWLLMSLCTVHTAPTYHFVFPDLSIDRINGRPMVPCIYFITLDGFLWSSVLGYLVLVHSNYTTSFMYGRTLFDRYNSCTSKWWRRSALVRDILVASSAISKLWCTEDVDDSPFMHYGISSIIFPMYSTMDNITLPGEEYPMFIPRYFYILPRMMVIFAIF